MDMESVLDTDMDSVLDTEATAEVTEAVLVEATVRVMEVVSREVTGLVSSVEVMAKESKPSVEVMAKESKTSVEDTEEVLAEATEEDSEAATVEVLEAAMVEMSVVSVSSVATDTEGVSKQKATAKPKEAVTGVLLLPPTPADCLNNGVSEELLCERKYLFVHNVHTE